MISQSSISPSSNDIPSAGEKHLALPANKFTNEHIKIMKAFAKKCEATNLNQLRSAFHSLQYPQEKEYTAWENNWDKNRYSNIMCLDTTRILLKPNNGYIHANKLEYKSLKTPYIITQGPLRETCTDFWRLVWQENAENIFMLCNCVEDGWKKCFEYFDGCGTNKPDRINAENRTFATLQYGDYNITPFQRYYKDGIVNTNIKISRGNESRLINHFQCTEWGDCEVPSSSGFGSNVINRLIHEMNKVKNRNKSNVIHCSAGIGRSGTLVAIQMLLEDYKNEQCIEVTEVIRKLREVRCQTVETFDQFLFIHKFILEYGEYYKLISRKEMDKFRRQHEEYSRQLYGRNWSSKTPNH